MLRIIAVIVAVLVVALIAYVATRPAGDATELTWAMYGPNTLVGKLMGLVFSMDKMVGGQFETGLAKLKSAAESWARAPSNAASTILNRILNRSPVPSLPRSSLGVCSQQRRDGQLLESIPTAGLTAGA